MTRTEKHIAGSFDQLDHVLDNLRRKREAREAGLRAIHRCRSCGCELSPEAVCGSYCHPCADGAAALHVQESARDRRVAWAFGTGFALGIVVLIAVQKLFGWLS